MRLAVVPRGRLVGGASLVACVAGFLLLAAPACRGESDFVLYFSSAAGDTSEQVAVDVLLDVNAEPITGWSVAVCHDTENLTLEEVDEGALFATANDGDEVDFSDLSLEAEGFGGGAIICITSCASLPVADGYLLYSASYTLDGLAPTSAALEFCDGTVAAVNNVVVIEGSLSVAPELIPGSIEIVGPEPLHFELSVEGATILYDPVDGLAEFDHSLFLEEAEADPTYPNAVDAFTLALAHDDLYLEAVGASPGAALASLNGGRGPAFFSASIEAGGVIIEAVVADTSGDEQFFAEGAAEAAVIHYATNPLALRFNLVGVTTELVWDDTLGTVDSPNDVEVADYFVGTTSSGATLKLNPRERFLRGDANGDGGVGISDALDILQYLFLAGSIVACDDAADTNDDARITLMDGVYLLNYLYLGGNSPAAPFPGCGFDVTGTSDCQAYNACE